jgi:outer membrane protein assembly factor BamB
MTFRIFLIAALLALVTGCSTIKGWFSSDKNKAIEPAELVDIASPIAIDAAWSRNLGDGRSRHGLRQRPAIDGDRLYVSNDEGRVLAIDIATGDTAWDSEAVAVGKTGSRWTFWKKRMRDGGVSGGPAVANGLVVAGGRNGEVVGLDAATGAERWRTTVTSEVLATPLIVNDLVVVRSGDGRTFGLAAADGARKWVFDRGLPNLSVRGNGSPIAGGSLVFLGYDDGSVIALRQADGALAWEQLIAEPDGRNDLERMADVDGEMQIGLTELFAASYHGQTVALATDNGRPLWTRDVGSYGGLALLADRLLVADPQGTVWALDRNSGSALWKQEQLARRWLTTPAVQGNYAVVGDVEGYLHWIRTDDGQIVGRSRIERAPILGTPQVAPSGMLIAVTSEGELIAYPQPQ